MSLTNAWFSAFSFFTMIQSGLTTVEPTEERYFVVLYSLALLPMISICDKVGFDDLFTSLIEDIGNYDARNFSIFIAQLQARYECLGISCEMIGQHSSTSGVWPECKAASFAITGYLPTSDSSREVSILSIFIYFFTQFASSCAQILGSLDRCGKLTLT